MELVQSKIYNGIEYKIGDYVRVKLANNLGERIKKIYLIDDETNAIILLDSISKSYSNLSRIICKEKDRNYNPKINKEFAPTFLENCIRINLYNYL